MSNVSPSQIYKNYRRRSFELCSIEIPDEITGLFVSMNEIARVLSRIDADWVKGVGIGLYKIRITLLMSLQEFDFQELQNYIPAETSNYVNQFPDLIPAWETFWERIVLCKTVAPTNNKRHTAIKLIESYKDGSTAIVQLPSLDRNIRDLGLRNAPYIWKTRQLSAVGPQNLIIPGSVWNRRQGFIDMALLGGFSQNIIQLKYKLNKLEFSLENYSSIRHLPVLHSNTEVIEDEDPAEDNSTSMSDAQQDPISSLFESTQSAIWDGFYKGLGTCTDDYMEDVRLCLLRGSMVVPLRVNKDVVTVEDDGSLIEKDIAELETEDHIILPADGYLSYRNDLTDKHLREEGHPELRELTAEWKGKVRDAIIKIGGADEFNSWSKYYGFSISNPQYAWSYTTDQVMLPRDKERFAKLMKTCYLILELDADEEIIDHDISRYWQSTGQLKSARRRIESNLIERCEHLVREQFRQESENEYQAITLEGHILWHIWTILDVGIETRSIPYSRIEIPRKVNYHE